MTALDERVTCPVDLTDAALYRDGVPYDVLAEVRDRHPVSWHRPIRLRTGHGVGATAEDDTQELDGFWVVAGHDEISAANRDWERFSAGEGPTLLPMPDGMPGSALVGMDPPDHTRLRKLVSAGFTPRMLRRLDENLQARTAKILEEAAALGTCDFVRDVAYQLPMHVIADIMGIPEAERPWVFQRTDLMLRSLDPGSAVAYADGVTARAELFGYADELGARKRKEPADDVWTALTQAVLTIEDGTAEELTQFELDMFFLILSIAGSETTRNALSQGLLALLRNPAQLEELRSDPPLIAAAVEEILRWSSPVLFFGRTAMVDLELGGAWIHAGDRVTLWYPAGNRDARTFPDPDRFDIHRSPNPHVSFGGGGAHYCLGASLAKRELHVMIEGLLKRFTEIELAGPAVWSGCGPVHNVGVSLNSMPVRLHSR